MDNSTQYEEVLMLYLDGLLPADEKAAFEKRLAADEALRAELENLQLARQAVLLYGRKQQVTAVHQSVMKELDGAAPVKQINPARRMVRRIVAVAATLVFAVLVWQGLLFYNLSAGKVFNENYIEYSPDNVRGEQNIDSVKLAYTEKDYKKVIRLVNGSASAETIMMAAHSELALGNNSNAINLFRKLIEQAGANKTDELKDAAEYNLILAYIRNKDFDLALELMNAVEGNPGHLYHDRITGKLFRQVKMLKWR